jgi:hypothetical protein
MTYARLLHAAVLILGTVPCLWREVLVGPDTLEGSRVVTLLMRRATDVEVLAACLQSFKHLSVLGLGSILDTGVLRGGAVFGHRRQGRQAEVRVTNIAISILRALHTIGASRSCSLALGLADEQDSSAGGHSSFVGQVHSQSRLYARWINEQRTKVSHLVEATRLFDSLSILGVRSKEDGMNTASNQQGL